MDTRWRPQINFAQSHLVVSSMHTIPCALWYAAIV